MFSDRMHALQPKHTKLNPDEKERLLAEYNVALTQLPKIPKKDPSLPEGCKKGDIVKIERKDDFTEIYYRVVI